LISNTGGPVGGKDIKTKEFLPPKPKPKKYNRRNKENKHKLAVIGLF
jgi:hypothetical protein